MTRSTKEGGTLKTGFLVPGGSTGIHVPFTTKVLKALKNHSDDDET